MPGLFSLKAAHTGDGASHSPLVFALSRPTLTRHHRLQNPRRRERVASDIKIFLQPNNKYADSIIMGVLTNDLHQDLWFNEPSIIKVISISF